MASSSQRISESLSSTEPSASQWKYDVFLSFRGEETRKGIAFELYDGLKNRGGIKTFMDDQEIQVGAPISPSLLKAIEESRFAIIVLSRNYASSSWCLEELTKIVDCMKDDNRILPLFYQVEPSDVRYQKRSFEIAFNEHEQKWRVEIEKLNKWRDALKTVANFSGWNTQNYKTERELVEVIVESVCNKVGRQVAEITKEAEQFLKDEIQATEEPHDSWELLPVITKLNETREFSSVSYVVPAKDVCLVPPQDYQKLKSRALTVERIMDELRSANSADIILVHGIGGVGKTTLAEEVLRQAEKEKLFDDSIMVRDVKKLNLEAIQKVIADKLGLNLSEIQTTAGRADKICDRIKGKKTGDESKQEKKTLVILDDVWEEIDLKAVGLPHIKTCRILLTSRTSKLFSADMINQKPFPLGVLGEEETWLLFEKRAGNIVEGGHIRTIATELAKNCGGLPLLVVTVASSLRSKTKTSVWRYALSTLERFDKEEELTKKAYSVIEWSYEQLNEHLKPLFLLCGAIVEGNSISVTYLFKYSMGLGFFRKTKTVKEARDALDTQVEKLKDSNLLLDGDDDTCVRMHDLVHHVVNQIASRDHHLLVQDGADDELKEWTEEDLFRCSKISLPCCNIATLPTVPWECPKLEMFHLQSQDDDSSRDMPSNFFEEMRKLKVLGLNSLPPISLPPSLKCLKNLQTLCLDGCKCEDIALIGELTSLQILSIVKSKVKQLPKEIGQLTSLRLLDLSDCSLLKVISPGVISNLTSLEDLRMRNSFDKWEGEGVIGETRNARLWELKNLSKLTALEIRIPDADILPPNVFSNKLERYQIVVGESKKRLNLIHILRKKWNRMYETTLNALKLQLTTSNELDQGLKMLLEKCDVLYLDGTKGFDFAYVFNTKEVMSNLTTLSVNRCGGLKYLLSHSSMPRNLKKLKHLEILECKIMEQIVSTREHNEEDNMFGELKSLKLKSLPNLTSFCTGKCIEFPLLEKLYIENCPKLGAFVGGPMTKSSRKGERGEKDSEESFDVHSDSTFVFDEKVKFPKLEILHFEPSKLQTIWHNQLAPGSFCRLREVNLRECESLKSIFPPSMMGRLIALETLTIYDCESVEVIFDVNETHGTSSTQLKDGQNLISVHIVNCGSLKNIFSASMATGCLQQLQELSVRFCREMESIVAKEERGLELTAPHPKFVFPKVKSMTFLHLPTLGSFYPGLHTSKWPLLKNLEVRECDEVEFLAAELSIFQERHPHAPTNQPLFLIDQETGGDISRDHDVETDVGWNALNSPPPAHKGVLTLRTASQLKEFKKTMDGLTGPKKGAIIDMGFGALHSLGGCKLNREICQLMVENFDVESCSVKIDGRSLCVNEGDFSRVMGIPCGESKVQLEGSMEHPLVRQLLSKVGNDNHEINIDGLKRIIEEGKEADQTFKVAFILYAFALVLCPTTPGRVESRLTIPLVDVRSIHTKNWASFCFHQLVEGVGSYKNNTDEYMSGCVLFLQLLYFDSVWYSSCIVPTSVVPVVAWTRGRANSIIKWILAQGGFTSKGVFASRGNCASDVWKKETMCCGIGELSDPPKGISFGQKDWDTIEADIGIVNSMMMHLEPNLGTLGNKLREIENSVGEQNVGVIENIVVEVMKALKDNGYWEELEGGDVDTVLNVELECDKLKTDIDQLWQTREFSTCPPVDSQSPASHEVADEKHKNKVECKADPTLFEQGQKSKMVFPEISKVKNTEPTATSRGKITRKDSKKLKFLLGNVCSSREEVARFADTGLFQSEIQCLVPRTPISCKIIDIIAAYLFEEDSTSWFFPASFGEQAISIHNNPTLSVPIGSIISVSRLWRFHRKLKRCKEIFLPLHDLMTGGWFLLVIKLDEHVGEIWDSAPVTLASSSRVDHAKAAMSLLQKVFASEMTRSSDLYYNFTSFGVTFPQGNPTNDNKYDSGLYVIRHMQHYRQNWFAGFNSDAERRMIALEIVNNPKNEVINRFSVAAMGKKRQNLDGEGTSKAGGKVKKPRQGPCASAVNIKINAHGNPPTGRKCRSHRKRRSRAGIV